MPQPTTMIDIKPYSTKELSAMYGVCPKTIKKWMRPFEEAIGQKQGRYFTVAQVTIIFDKLGLPASMEDD